MKIDRVLELLKIERECVTRQSPCNEKSKLCDRNCGECDIAQNDLELIEMYDFVISMIETLIGRSQWISVKDRLPKSKPDDLEYPTVIIALPDGSVELGCYYESTHEWGAGEWFDEPRKPIAWMPLPEPPEVKQDGQH